MSQKFDNIVKMHFNEICDLYDEKSRNRANYINTINDIIRKVCKNGDLLDIGCGSGTRYLELELKNINYFGCDISDNMANSAKEKGLNIKIGDIRKLPYPDKKFDYILCIFHVFCYLSTKKDQLNALKEMKRVLKKDGVIIIDIINFFHLGENLNYKDNFFNIYINALINLVKNKSIYNKTFILKNSNCKNVLGFMRSFTYKYFENILNKSDFKIKKFYTIGYDSGNMYKDKFKGNFCFLINI